MSRELVAYDEIQTFYDEDWISDVLYPVKSGKEATVYCCRAVPRRNAKFFALKVYHDRTQRNFKNDALYLEGRFRRETREVRAMRTKTARGREFHAGAWIGHEYETLKTLREQGADVPRPLAVGENAILMEYVGDAESAAPLLQTVVLLPFEAERLWERMLRNVELMLRNNLVHGDLSAYNVLYWQRGLKIIDFPQAVDPRFNPNARTLLQRDVEHLYRYFGRCGVQADPARIAARLWWRFQNADL